MIRDTERRVSIRLHTDPTAPTGIATRVGLGKVRDLDAALPWTQHHVSRRNLQIHKFAGSENQADIGMKGVKVETLLQLMDINELRTNDGGCARVAHDKGLSLGTENVSLDMDGEDENDTDIDHVERENWAKTIGQF